MKRNGKTSAGKTRRRRTARNTSSTQKTDNPAKLPETFLGWLLSRRRQGDMPGEGRAFRRKRARFWAIWPMPPKVEGQGRAIFADGTHLGRKAAAPIAAGEEHVLGWHLCRTENGRSRSAPVSRIAAPCVVVSDGRGRLCEGTREDVAWGTSPKMRPSRLLAGRALHSLAPSHAGGGRALRPCQGASCCCRP